MSRTAPSFAAVFWMSRNAPPFRLGGRLRRRYLGLCNEDVYRWQGCIVGQFGAKDINDAVFSHTQNSSVDLCEHVKQI